MVPGTSGVDLVRMGVSISRSLLVENCRQTFTTLWRSCSARCMSGGGRSGSGISAELIVHRAALSLAKEGVSLFAWIFRERTASSTSRWGCPYSWSAAPGGAESCAKLGRPARGGLEHDPVGGVVMACCKIAVRSLWSIKMSWPKSRGLDQRDGHLLSASEGADTPQ
jgi:hypothetical protein